MSVENTIKENINTIKGKKAVNGIGIKGFIELELVRKNKDGTLRRVYRNTITPTGKQMMLVEGAQRILATGGSFQGRMAILSALHMMVASSSYGVRSAWNNRDLTNVLLNLPNPQALSEASSYIPVLSEAGEKSYAGNVVGYANNDVMPTKDGMNGSEDYILSDYFKDSKVVTGRWKYDLGVGTGKINAVGMVPLSVVKSGVQGLGIRAARCLDRVNPLDPGFAAFSTAYCPPGIGGITNDDEVLLNYNQGGSNQHKINLSTGVTTDIISNWPGLPIPGNTTGRMMCDYFYDGSRYLYTIDCVNNINMTYTWNCSVFDTQGGVISYITNFSVGAASSNFQAVGAYFVFHEGQLYISFLSVAAGNVQSQYGLYPLTKSTQPYYTNIGAQQQNFNTIGFVRPESLAMVDFALKSLANGRYALITRGLPQTTGNEGTDYTAGAYCNKAYIFTDLTNPIGSIVGVLEWLPRNSVIFSNPTRTGVLSIGLINANQVQANSYDPSGAVINVKNNSQSSATQLYGGAGLWYSDESWSSNAVSYAILTTPIEKLDEDILFVTYGYRVI